MKMMSVVKSAKAQLRTKTPRIYEILYHFRKFVVRAGKLAFCTREQDAHTTDRLLQNWGNFC